MTMLKEKELKKTIRKLDKYLSDLQNKPFNQFSFKDFCSYTFYRGKLWAYSFCLQEIIKAEDYETKEWLNKVLDKHKRYVDY